MSNTDQHIDLTSDPEFSAVVPDSVAEPSSDAETFRAALEQANEQKLRVLAELENFRTRTNRMIADERKYASIDLMRDLLPIWDNMNRALEAADKTKDIDTLIEGIRMISDQFIAVLGRHDCKPIEALHSPFDPNVHASIAQQPTEEHPVNTIIYESQVGFKLHDRIVRPSQVVLAAKPE